MTTRPGAMVQAACWAFEEGRHRRLVDELATEEPLEIRIGTRPVAVTMRTPGRDFQLAAGFLVTERVIGARSDIRRIKYCTEREQAYNVVTVDLAPGIEPDLRELNRHFLTTSACGVCGRVTLESLTAGGCVPLQPGPPVAAGVLLTLPDRLRQAQEIFSATGGLHAAALFDLEGHLIQVCEDIGRHNALDKLIGWSLLEADFPLGDRILLVSGRASYEIMQKSLVARIPIVCAVSAPSSLAVSVAEEFNMTLAGFLRDTRFNVYTGLDRVR